MRKLIVNNSKNNKISKYIMSIYPNLSYNSLQKAFRNKDIKINSKRISEDIVIKDGDIIEIYISDEILFNIPKSIKYYYNDENIVIAYKWQGILSNNEEKITLNEPTFEELVKKDLNLNDLCICHRLDRNTSGLVIFAKSKDIFDVIIDLFKNHEIEKHYIAYVNNINFNSNHKILKGYITYNKEKAISKIYDKDIKNSQEISTEYSVIKKNKEKNFAVLDITLHTGKMHQIRAHMAHIDHCIIGDSKYGNNEINKKFKKSKQMLIAYKYKFNITNKCILSYLNGKEISINEEEVLNLL